MSLHGSIKAPKNGMEKYYLREAFKNYIPDSVLYRRKEGFSDGVGGVKKPWYKHIQEWLNVTKNNILEKDYYNEIYNRYFGDEFKQIDEYWMPKWYTTTDPSGRVLSVFGKGGKIL